MDRDPIKEFASSLVAAREEYEEETRRDLLLRMESLFNRWISSNYAGFDATLGDEQERIEGLEKALKLLSDIHEEWSDD